MLKYVESIECIHGIVLPILNNDMKIIIKENKINDLIQTKGLEKVIKIMGGVNNFAKVMGYDDVKSYIYDYLEDNWSPDNGWKDSEFYIDYVKRYGTYQFKINGEIEYTYSLGSYSGVTTLQILSDLYIQMRDLFGEEDNWVNIFKDWFEDKTNMAVDNVI